MAAKREVIHTFIFLNECASHLCLQMSQKSNVLISLKQSFSPVINMKLIIRKILAEHQVAFFFLTSHGRIALCK